MSFNVENDEVQVTVNVMPNATVNLNGVAYDDEVDTNGIVFEADLTPEQTRTLYDNLTKMYKQQKKEQVHKYNDQINLDL